MKGSRRLAWIVFVSVLLIILAVGLYQASQHEETRPETAPAPAASSPG